MKSRPNPEWVAMAPTVARRELEWHLRRTYAGKDWARRALESLGRTTDAALATVLRRDIDTIVLKLRRGELTCDD